MTTYMLRRMVKRPNKCMLLTVYSRYVLRDYRFGNDIISWGRDRLGRGHIIQTFTVHLT